MFLKAFPNRILRLGQAPWKPHDYVGSAGSLISREMPVYGQNAHSHLFLQILTSNMYVFSEISLELSTVCGRPRQGARIRSLPSRLMSSSRTFARKYDWMSCVLDVVHNP